MKNRIEYVYSCTNAMFRFLHDNDLDVLLEDLKRIEAHAVDKYGNDEGESMWFRFFKGDTLATDIRNIENDLSLPEGHSNYKLLVERFDMVTKDINPENELRVYFS